MKIEDAIQYLKEPIGKNLAEHEEAVNMAIKALEKQIPKAPIFIIGSSYAWNCPNCGERATNECCGECGQKFDWESAD